MAELASNTSVSEWCNSLSVTAVAGVATSSTQVEHVCVVAVAVLLTIVALIAAA